MSELYEIPVKTLSGEDTNLGAYRDRVLLVVTVASKCGFTKQYEGLEKLHRDLEGRGLTVLGFPCNQFGGQEPGSEEEIEQFCKLTYDVTFPMFSKVEVNGDGTHPIYAHLKNEAPGLLGTQAIKWNFTKFLVDRNGKVVDRFGSQTTPEKIRSKVEELL